MRGGFLNVECECRSVHFSLREKVFAFHSSKLKSFECERLRLEISQAPRRNIWN